MFKPKYSMFFDMHTMQKCPDVGHNFDAADFASELHKAGVELVGFHAKCNQGFCYFDTQKGIRHPSLRPGHDLFGDVVRECNKLGIQVSAYFNCGLSYENALEHTDWCRIGLDGNITSMLSNEIFAKSGDEIKNKVLTVKILNKNFFILLYRKIKSITII